MPLHILTPPAAEPVTLQEAKDHLRVAINEDDALIEAFIIAARRWCEQYQHRTFVSTQYRYKLDAWPCADMRLPTMPLRSIEAFTYRTVDGDVETVSAETYTIDADAMSDHVLLLTSWPSAQLWPRRAITIDFTAGYPSAASVPEEIKAAIKLMVGDLYENREDTLIAQGVNIKSVPNGVKALLGIDKRRTF